MMSRSKATAKDVITLASGSYNTNNVNIARAVNYNAVILKDALDRIAELERLLTPQESEEEKTIKRWE